jgi:hypothetical protein
MKNMVAATQIQVPDTLNPEFAAADARDIEQGTFQYSSGVKTDGVGSKL